MNTVEKLKKWAPSALELPKLVEMLRLFIAHSQNPAFEPIRDVVKVDSIQGAFDTINASIVCATRSKELFDSLGLSPQDFPIQPEVVMIGEKSFASVCGAIYGMVLFWIEEGPVARKTFEMSGFGLPHVSYLIAGLYEVPNNLPLYKTVDGELVTIRPWMDQPLRIDNRISLAGIVAELATKVTTKVTTSNKRNQKKRRRKPSKQAQEIYAIWKDSGMTQEDAYNEYYKTCENDELDGLHSFGQIKHELAELNKRAKQKKK